MISGMLPNNTIWWLSTNGQKIWIESKDLEQDKFKEKGYNIKHDIIFHVGQSVGELTTSRLESRKRKDAWIIKMESVIDIYPELVEEIQKKDSENKKKKRVSTSKNRKTSTQKTLVIKEEPRRECVQVDKVLTENVEINNKINNIDTFRNANTSDNTAENRNDKEPRKYVLDVNSPCVSWIKEEVEKSDAAITITFRTMKEKIGGEFPNMDDLRIFLVLQQILSKIGIKVEKERKAREYVMIMKKIPQSDFITA